MTQVVLIRPGATAYDEQNRVQGILDIPLSPRGEAEVAQLAETLAEPLAGVELAALYCGPGESTLQTAEVIGKALGLRPKRVDELRNLDQGLRQGLQVDEIKRRNLKVFRQWLDDPVTVCPPHGETVENALEGILKELLHLISRHDYEAICLFVGVPIGQLAVVPVAAAFGDRRVAVVGGLLYVAIILSAFLSPSVRTLRHGVREPATVAKATA